MLKSMDQFGEGPAQLRYGADAEYVVLRPGRFVRCAVTGEPIALEDLRYWSEEFQEAYVDAKAATERWRRAHDKAAR
jgi:hypothetical protein